MGSAFGTGRESAPKPRVTASTSASISGRLIMDTFKNPLRVFQGPADVTLTAAEEDAFTQMGNRVGSMKEGRANYVVWRRSQLQWLLFTLTPLTLGLTLITAVKKLRDIDFEDSTFQETTARTLATMEFVAGVLPPAQAALLAVGNGYSLWLWPHWRQSAKGAMVCYIVAFFMPFLIWLMPWAWLLDINDAVAQLCGDNIKLLTNIDESLKERCCGTRPGEMLGAGLFECVTGSAVDPQENPGMFFGAHYIGMLSWVMPIYMLFVVFLEMLRTLFPSMLGMVFGQIKACLIVADLQKDSHMPAVLLVTIVLSGTPMVAFLAVMPLALAGTPWGSCGSLLLILGFGVYLYKPMLLVEGSVEERAAALRRRRIVGLVLKPLGVALLVVSVLTASYLRGYEEHLPALEEILTPLSATTFVAKFLMFRTFATISMADMILLWSEAATTAMQQDGAPRRKPIIRWPVISI